jgi:glycosyltransferase
MKISIVTPCYNSVLTIEATIQGVLSQKNVDVEHIVIDGGSTDGTVDIIKKYNDKIFYWVSEKDNGIYDAMNRGIKMASGKIIGILNSDDLFDNDKVLANVIEAFRDEKIEAVYGDVGYFSTDVNKMTRIWRAGEYRENKLNNGWIIPHPALFLHRTVYEKCGLFNSNFKIAGDYEFILRILKIYRVNIKYFPRVLVRMYNGGASGRDIGQRRIGWKELKRAWLVNNLKIPSFFIARRILSKLTQFLI